jgi:hypothetical protein
MITGSTGFLYNELLLEDSDDFLFLLGGPTVDDKVLNDKYVQESKELIARYKGKYIVFASTLDGDDYYTKAKREIEYFLGDKGLILKIAPIISRDIKKVHKMKPSRVQPTILRNEFKEILMKDTYLDLDQFISETKDLITNRIVGTHHYQLTELSLFDLRRYASD